MLPVAHFDSCEGYAACFNDANFTALKHKLALVESDDHYARLLYTDETRAYQEHPCH